MYGLQEPEKLWSQGDAICIYVISRTAYAHRDVVWILDSWKNFNRGKSWSSIEPPPFTCRSAVALNCTSAGHTPSRWAVNSGALANDCEYIEQLSEWTTDHSDQQVSNWELIANYVGHLKNTRTASAYKKKILRKTEIFCYNKSI